MSSPSVKFCPGPNFYTHLLTLISRKYIILIFVCLVAVVLVVVFVAVVVFAVDFLVIPLDLFVISY